MRAEHFITRFDSIDLLMLLSALFSLFFVILSLQPFSVEDVGGFSTYHYALLAFLSILFLTKLGTRGKIVYLALIGIYFFWGAFSFLGDVLADVIVFLIAMLPGGISFWDWFTYEENVRLLESYLSLVINLFSYYLMARLVDGL